MNVTLKALTLVTGHYGSGKTNFALNLACQQAELGKSVTLVDLDIVNPYFRSSDYPDLLSSRGIRLIAPKFAGQTLDAPGLPPDILAAFDKTYGDNDVTIIDVGGDSVGSTALGRFAPRIRAMDSSMLYVVNNNRPEIAAPRNAVAILREIETVSRLSASAIVNNSHLMGGTTPEVIESSVEYAGQVSELTGLPILLHTAPIALAGLIRGVDNLMPVEIYVKKPWE
jgi:MinD-like ATPase involved in chromosome partitioning or flagellar assembly